jgi:hypothetical protein
VLVGCVRRREARQRIGERATRDKTTLLMVQAYPIHQQTKKDITGGNTIDNE